MTKYQNILPFPWENRYYCARLLKEKHGASEFPYLKENKVNSCAASKQTHSEPIPSALNYTRCFVAETKTEFQILGFFLQST